MTIIDAGEYTFKYDNSLSFEGNFSLWAQLNTEERLAFNEQPYSREEQEKIFSKLFSKKA
jgi:hypothetical protein